MAISHIASIRGSARMAAQQQRAAAAAESASVNESFEENKDNCINKIGRSSEEMNGNLSQSIDQSSAKLTVISISDDDNLSQMVTSTSMSSQIRQNRMRDHISAPPPLEVLTSVADIDSHFEVRLHQVNTLNRLEEKWMEITENFGDVVTHLHECSDQINEAALNCLKALLENVGTTCDKVDIELKAMFHLMTKCDELTTKLSIATSFRDEIKTLLKSIETLEQLYKAQSHHGRQKNGT